jgi:hypothetical protein
MVLAAGVSDRRAPADSAHLPEPEDVPAADEPELDGEPEVPLPPPASGAGEDALLGLELWPEEPLVHEDFP